MLSSSSLIFGFFFPTRYWTRSTPYWCSVLLLFSVRFVTFGSWLWIKFDLSNGDLARFLIISTRCVLSIQFLNAGWTLLCICSSVSGWLSSCSRESPCEIRSFRFNSRVCPRLQALRLQSTTTFFEGLFMHSASTGLRRAAAVSQIWNFLKSFPAGKISRSCRTRLAYRQPN